MTLALESLSARSEALIRQVEEVRTVAPGTIVMREGDPPDEIMRIVSGSMAVVRSDEAGRVHRIAQLETGELVGEMGFVDHAPRSASVRAEEETTFAMLSATGLAAKAGGSEALAELRAVVAATIVHRMRVHNDRYVDALQRELDSLKEREQFGIFFLYTFATLCVGTVVHEAISARLVDVDVYSIEFGWQAMLFFIVPLLGVIAWMRLPLRALGLTRKNLRRSVLEALAISAAIVALLIVLRTQLVAYGVTLRPITLFTPAQAAAYAAHSFLQELLARGFVQTSYQRFLNDRRGVISVILSSVSFGIFHLHYGLHAVALTTLGGFVFGAIFLRHGNLAGVTLVHFVVGLTALSLGLI